MKKQVNNQIPDTGHTYKEYRFKTETCILIYKKIGFTPLQVLNEIKPYINDDYKNKLTFIGRLDPMAEGYIHILWSGDMDEKKVIMDLDKQYEVEVLLGVKTDTCDILGVIDSVDYTLKDLDIDFLRKFIGPFKYDYPKYSSPHIKKVLKGDDFKTKKQDGEIYDIEFLGLENISSDDLENKIFSKLDLCQMEGDFRLDIIKNDWKKFFEENKSDFKILKIRVDCKRGTYMRVLARELGGLALSIVRK